MGTQLWPRQSGSFSTLAVWLLLNATYRQPPAGVVGGGGGGGWWWAW
jgi:hypothetical protein